MLIKSFAILATLMISAALAGKEEGKKGLEPKKGNKVTLMVAVSVDEEGKEANWKLPEDAHVMELNVGGEKAASPAEEKSSEETEQSPDKEATPEVSQFDSIEKEDAPSSQPARKEPVAAVEDFDSLLQEEEETERQSQDHDDAPEDDADPYDIEDPRAWTLASRSVYNAKIATSKRTPRSSRYPLKKPFFEERIPSHRRPFEIKVKTTAEKIQKTTPTPAPFVKDPFTQEDVDDPKDVFDSAEALTQIPTRRQIPRHPLRRSHASRHLSYDPYLSFDSLYYHPASGRVRTILEDEKTAKAAGRRYVPRRSQSSLYYESRRTIPRESEVEEEDIFVASRQVPREVMRRDRRRISRHRLSRYDDFESDFVRRRGRTRSKASRPKKDDLEVDRVITVLRKTRRDYH